MRHEPSKGFSFELPDGWHRDEHNLQITYFGPEGRIGSTRQVIQLQIGGILPQYHTPEAREKFLAEPGATVHRTVIGGETNAVVLKKQSNSEMSIVRDAIQYTFAYGHDTETLRAMDLVKETTRFPTPDTASSELHRWSDPKAQAVSRMLHGKAPIPASQRVGPSQEEKPRGFLSRILGFLQSEPSEPAVQTCETCSHQMQVLGFSGGGSVMLSAEDLAAGIGQAEQCWECGKVYCSECYPSRPRNTCVCGRGRDAVRHVGGTVYRGSMRLVKVRYIS
jgi:hypothetical protein